MKYLIIFELIGIIWFGILINSTSDTQLVTRSFRVIDESKLTRIWYKGMTKWKYGQGSVWEKNVDSSTIQISYKDSVLSLPKHGVFRYINLDTVSKQTSSPFQIFRINPSTVFLLGIYGAYVSDVERIQYDTLKLIK